jgi:hypothetical protein
MLRSNVGNGTVNAISPALFMSAPMFCAARFPLGRIAATLNALARLTQEDILLGIARHQSGDWGDISDQDRIANELSVQEGSRVRSCYRSARGVQFWIETEISHSATRVLLPQES